MDFTQEITKLTKPKRGRPLSPKGQVKALEEWSKQHQAFLKEEEIKGLASNYLWEEFTLEEKVERLRQELLKT